MCRAGAVVLLSFLPACRTDPGEPAAKIAGVVIHHQPSPSPWKRMTGRSVYTASPSIAILPDGAYVVSCNTFGPGSGARRSGTTYIYRSEDRGRTWAALTVLRDMKRGSLFVHRGSLYLFGYTAAPGSIVIRKSVDGGSSWSEPRDPAHGLLRDGTYGGTPFNPVIHDGRIWMAVRGTQVMSAHEDADLLCADAWTLSRSAQTKKGPLGPGLTISEAQIVGAPHTGVVLLPKVQHPAARIALLHVADPHRVKDPLPADWVPFPGGEKKFFATYDSVSGRFFALSNPVDPAYADQGVPYNLVRNIGALLVSDDLRTWRIHRVVLHSPNVEFEAFQYFNAEIDGEDLIVVSRTALHIDRHRPPRGHDSNLVTFHRIPDFRAPDPAKADTMLAGE